MLRHPTMRAVLREPLLHFLLIGAALFALDGLRSRRDGADRRIVVSELLREELAQGWASTRSGPPPPAELDGLIEGWIDEEVLYREGLARGFGQDDPAVRARVASQMALVLRARVVVPEPTEAELRAHFEAHRERWARGERIDFTHVFVEGVDEEARDRAGELLDLLRRGASPAQLGDRFSGGRRYRMRERDDLGRTFGEEFAAGVADQPGGTWHLQTSRFGHHLVRVDARRPAEAPAFEAVRGDVRAALVEDREERLVAGELAALRARWEIERAP